MAEIAKKRGRPAGSTKKPQNRGGVAIMQFEKQIENAPICRTNAQYDIVQWGSKNSYPFDLVNLYNTSVTHRACIDFATNAIIGEGIDWEKMGIKNGDIPNPNYSMSWNQFIKALSFELCLYSGFAFQVIKNKDNKTYNNIAHI